MRKLQPSPETIAFIALAVSVLALVVSLYESYNNRKTARAAVRPIVLVSFEFNESGLGWELSNGGLGPAVIEWFEVHVDGTPVPSWEFVGKALDLQKGTGYSFILPAGGTYSAGVNKKLFWLDPGKEEDRFKENSRRIKFRYCYCSLQDECWLDEVKKKAERIDSCSDIRALSIRS